MTHLPTPSATLSTLARDLRTEVESRFLPWWIDTIVDRTHGGYVIGVPRGERKRDGDVQIKALVTQARAVWAFSHAQVHGLHAGGRDLVEAARIGARFLLDRMWDSANGGFIWQAHRDGSPRNPAKHVYGQVFAIYALVEFHRASGEAEPLERALEIFRIVQAKTHDDRDGGWFEDNTEDWTRITDPLATEFVDVPGLKSSNTHLHVMEAYAELFQATRDQAVKAALEESVAISRDRCYSSPAGASFTFADDWTPTGRPGISYGHNVEFAWLLIRAEEVLGRAPSWGILRTFIDHALANGYDHQRGGLYNAGPSGAGMANDTSKNWWAQAELLAALSDVLRHDPQNPGDVRIMAQVLAFSQRHLVSDPANGIWMDTVAADGTPIAPSLAHAWKANYHDLRGFVKVIEVGGAR